jgi:hypothetical protein
MTVTTYDDKEVCNTSLNMIGVEPIVSISNPTTDNEATCAKQFKLLSTSLLSRKTWNWVKSEAELAADADRVPIKKFIRAFRLPPDLSAGPFAVYADNSRTPASDYEIFGDHIHCDFGKVVIDYRGGADSRRWPGYFLDLYITALASRLAIALREDQDMADRFHRIAFGAPEEKGLGGMMATAMTIDAQSKPIQSLYRNGDFLTGTRY